MTKLPRGISGKETIRALEKAGFYSKRQKGSHVVLRRDNPFAQVIVPNIKMSIPVHYHLFSMEQE